MATLIFRLSSRSEAATGQSEILARFFHGHFEQRARTSIFVPVQYWNATTQRVTVPKARVMSAEAKALASHLSAVNGKIEDLRIHINDAFIKAGAGKKELPKKWLSDVIMEYYFPKAQKPRAVIDMLESFIKERADAESESNTRHAYAIWRAFNRFLIYSRMKSATIDEITDETLHAFADYLHIEYTFYDVEVDKEGSRHVVYLDKHFKAAFEAVPESRLPAQRGQNAINRFLIYLRTFFKWAESNGIISNSPFRKYSIPQSLYGTPYYITIEERNRLAAFDLSDRPRLEQQRDVFVFQCVIGCRVSDLRSLTKASIIRGAVEYIPRKTKDGNPVTVRVPLNSVALQIVERYKDLPGEKLLPCISDQNYNYAIKEVFKAAGLTRPVTILNPTTRQEEKRPLNEVASSHLARRCFIGNLYKQVQDPNLIGKLSGHVEGSKAFARYRDIDEDMRRDLVSMLE